MEKLIVFGGRALALLEEQLEKATDETFHDAETLCSDNGITVERQAWAFMFVATHLVLWRVAQRVYQHASERLPIAAEKLQEAIERTKANKQNLAMTSDDDGDSIAVVSSANDAESPYQTNDLPVAAVDTVPLLVADASGNKSIASFGGIALLDCDAAADIELLTAKYGASSDFGKQ